jgi:excisionase family DNA binding protein
MLTSSALAQELGISKQTISRLAQERRIPFFQLPSGHRRFDLEAVKEALFFDAGGPPFIAYRDARKGKEREAVILWRSQRKKIESIPDPEERRRLYEILDDEFEKRGKKFWPIDACDVDKNKGG